MSKQRFQERFQSGRCAPAATSFQFSSGKEEGPAQNTRTRNERLKTKIPLL